MTLSPLKLLESEEGNEWFRKTRVIPETAEKKGNKETGRERKVGLEKKECVLGLQRRGGMRRQGEEGRLVKKVQCGF